MFFQLNFKEEEEEGKEIKVQVWEKKKMEITFPPFDLLILLKKWKIKLKKPFSDY